MLQINRVLMLVMMLTGACAMQAPPERQQTKDSELVAPDQGDGDDCASVLNSCYTSCQRRTQPVSCYTQCDTDFDHCTRG